MLCETMISMFSRNSFMLMHRTYVIVVVLVCSRRLFILAAMTLLASLSLSGSTANMLTRYCYCRYHAFRQGGGSVVIRYKLRVYVWWSNIADRPCLCLSWLMAFVASSPGCPDLVLLSVSDDTRGGINQLKLPLGLERKHPFKADGNSCRSD